MFKMKNLLMFTIMALVVVLATACGDSNSQESSGTPEQQEENGDNSNEGTNEDNSGETYTIRMASPSNPEDSNVKAFLEFEKIVEENSNGQIEVEVLHSGQVGGHAEYVDSLQAGNLEMAELNTSILAGIDDSFMIFTMPYIAQDMDHMIEVIGDGVGEQVNNALEEKTGITITGWMVRSPRDVYSAKGPIETPEDFKGLNIRVMETPVMIETMELLGATPTPVSAEERYMALQTGVVDAAENSVPLIVTEQEYEVTDYVSMTGHFGNVNVIATDTNFLNELPEDLRQVVLEASEEAAQFAIEEEKRQLETAIETLEEHGMEINDIPDKSPFIEIVQPIYEEYEDQVGKDLFDAFLNTP